MNMRDIGETVRRVREAQNIPRSKMAEDLRLDEETIEKFEDGKVIKGEDEIDPTTLLRCLDYVHLDIEIIPKKFGYTLEDAQRDNLEEANGYRLGEREKSEKDARIIEKVLNRFHYNEEDNP